MLMGNTACGGLSLKTFVKEVFAHFGRCFRTMFCIHLGPGALPNLSPLTAFSTSEDLVKFGSLAEA
jgi:hypothetical protein